MYLRGFPWSTFGLPLGSGPNLNSVLSLPSLLASAASGKIP